MEKDLNLRQFHGQGRGKGYPGSTPLSGEVAMPSHLFVYAWCLLLAAIGIVVPTVLPPAYWWWLKVAMASFFPLLGENRLCTLPFSLDLFVAILGRNPACFRQYCRHNSLPVLLHVQTHQTFEISRKNCRSRAPAEPVGIRIQAPYTKP